MLVCIFLRTACTWGDFQAASSPKGQGLHQEGAMLENILIECTLCQAPPQSFGQPIAVLQWKATAVEWDTLIKLSFQTHESSGKM